MKYCPYCGAELTIDAASFCINCGKTLPGEAQQELPKKPTPSREKKNRMKKEKPVAPVDEETAEEWYDGYYEDVLPSDYDRLKEGPDKELIRKIAAVTGVMLLIITLCVVAMYVL